MTGKAGRILGIDPGIANVGWGIITASGNYKDSGHITTPSHWDIEDRIYYISLKIRIAVKRYKPEIVVIEQFNSNRSMRNRKNLHKITMVYGALVLIARTHKIQIILANPNAWMRRFLGLTRTDQFSKLDIRRRVNKTLGTRIHIEHEAEALGMALSILKRGGKRR